GGTATVFPLILGDYARTLLEIDRFKPTEEEIERYIEEVKLYDEIISRQYKLSDEEVRKIIIGCPVCINGEPTEDREAVAHRDLERIPTNKVRGGMCLVVSEGVGLKAAKILTYAKMLGLNWDWLQDIIKFQKGGESSLETEPTSKYLSKIAAGRPIFCYPSRRGGFRLRYGKARNTGIMGRGIHPATMHVLDNFIAVGTQLKIERPGKSAESFAVDSIEGPIVKLSSGEVKQLGTVQDVERHRHEIEKILFLGDILVSMGDFRKTAHPLLPAGYCEEWWALEFKHALKENDKEFAEDFPLKKILQNPKEIDCFNATEISMRFRVPLHPKYIHFYNSLKKEEIKMISEEVKKAKKEFKEDKIVLVRFKKTDSLKQSFEKICLPHKTNESEILVEKEFAYPFIKTFGAFSNVEPNYSNENLEILSELCGLKIMDKEGTFIGARMGRPEQATPRKMVGNPHVLFPIGISGGNTRSINKAAQQFSERKYGEIEVELATFYCHECKQITFTPFCTNCGQSTKTVYNCKKCKATLNEDYCKKCREPALPFSKRKIELEKLFNDTIKKLNIKTPEIVKGVKGLINAHRIAEPLEKGVLRALHNVHIFRDGTIRFEMLNAPLTHFKPKEIGTSIEKLKELGYETDYEENLLEKEDQLVELFPQDLIVNEEAGNFLVKVTKFVDDELEKFYRQKKVFSKNSKEEMVGELVLGLAPHTSAAVIGRIIGYTKARVCFANPYFHLAKRRNCLTGDTPVFLQNSKKLKSIKIEDLDDGTMEGEIPLNNIFANTINEKGGLETRKVNALLKRESPKKIFKIKTKYGREIEITADHKLLSHDGKKIFTKKVSEFLENDPVLSLAKIKINSKQKEIDALEWYIKNSSTQEKAKLRVHNIKKELNKWVKEFGGCWKLSKKTNYKSGKSIHTAIYFDAVPLDLFEKILVEMKKTTANFSYAKISYNKQKSKIPAVISLGRELGEIIGYYLADGHARTTKKADNKKYVYQINFVSDEKEITRKFLENIQKNFGRKLTVESKNGLDYLTLSGRVYYDLFVKILGCGKGAKDKRVPKQVLNADKECVKGTVAGYIVGDGYIDSNSIKTISVNKMLVNDFCLLFNRLGCFPHLYSENREIKTGIVKKFYEKKERKIKINSFGIKLYSQDLLEIGKELFGRKKKKFEEIKKTTKFLKKRVKKIGNFVLDKINKIEEIESKSKYVYDLIIEGEKNYIAGFGNLAVYDCDGDQDSIMLLMDALLNFSESYLPESRGGRMDAPLVFTTVINPTEIDDEAYEIETCSEYPLSLYEQSQKFTPPQVDGINRVQDKLGTQEQYSGFYFTHSTSIFDDGPKSSGVPFFA
ncbi:MAG: DNA polymerase II large subunit, partial [Candidatus Diapherotrites archaeon]|nr:DNA polymerase II large subunit [Candidatus Diapherotrites archaeon]